MERFAVKVRLVLGDATLLLTIGGLLVALFTAGYQIGLQMGLNRQTFLEDQLTQRTQAAASNQERWIDQEAALQGDLKAKQVALDSAVSEISDLIAKLSVADKNLAESIAQAETHANAFSRAMVSLRNSEKSANDLREQLSDLKTQNNLIQDEKVAIQNIANTIAVGLLAKSTMEPDVIRRIVMTESSKVAPGGSEFNIYGLIFELSSDNAGVKHDGVHYGWGQPIIAPGRPEEVCIMWATKKGSGPPTFSRVCNWPNR